MKLPAVVWLAMVYYNATIAFYGPHTSPTAIFTSLTVAIFASSRHWHFYRQSGMCSGTVYPFYTHITVRAGTYMFMLEFQLARAWPFFLFFENFESMQRNSKTRASEPAETTAEKAQLLLYKGHARVIPYHNRHTHWKTRTAETIGGSVTLKYK